MCNTSRQPVVVIGMHRSGTSLVTRSLETLGLFVGYRNDSNHEARFFQRLNNWLLYQSSATWDQPTPIYDLLKDTETWGLIVDYLNREMRGLKTISFLGPALYCRRKSIPALELPWGWKDPRNTFTLPLWLEVFPGARIIHVYRHGVDVAYSLKKRRDKTFEKGKKRYLVQRRLFGFKSKRGSFSHSLRCASLEGAFSLWREYMQAARSHVHDLREHTFEIGYEAFLADPQESLKMLAAFCDLSPTEQHIRQVTDSLNRDRAFAYRSNPNLHGFAERVSEQLELYGY